MYYIVKLKVSYINFVFLIVMGPSVTSLMSLVNVSEPANMNDLHVS